MIQLLISLPAILLAFLLYRKRPKRFLLRLLPIIILLLILTNFSYNLKIKKQIGLPLLLIDLSPSMTDYLRIVQDELAKIKFEYKMLAFSESIYILPNLPDTPVGRFTDINAAIVKAMQYNPSAIILVSDGNHNYGPSPLTQMKESKTPIFAFGIGNESSKDQRIIDLFYPEYVFKNDTINIEVIIESRGFSGGNGRVILKSLNEDFDWRQKYSLSERAAQTSVNFKIPAFIGGTQHFKIIIEDLPEETDLQNNQREFFLDVLEKKTKVFYYTDHLSFNTKFIVPRLKENSLIDLQAIARIGPDKFQDITKNEPTNLPEISKFDILVLDNINGTLFLLTNLNRFLEEGKGILFLGSIQGMTVELREILPIDITGKKLEGNFNLKILRNFSSLSPQDSLPPVHSINQVIGFKSGLINIAEIENLPAIGYRVYKNGIVFQINVIDIGLWHFTQTGFSNKETIGILLDDIIRLLSPWGRKERLILKVRQQQYLPGEVLHFRLTSYDKNFLRASGGDFFLQWGRKRIPFFEIKSGIYETEYIPEIAGEFDIFATGNLGEEELKSNTVRIKINQTLRETKAEMNKQLLQEIAERTGGKYYPLSEIDKFQPPTHRLLHETKKISPDIPVSYLLIFILLAIDWFLRRKEGLI